MRLFRIGGNHPRHLAFINTVARAHTLCGGIMETREHMRPEPPLGARAEDRELFIRHFALREEAEARYFGAQAPPDCELLVTDRFNLNGELAANFARAARPDLVLIFGCGLIKGELARALPRLAVNLHLGLSPRYRGSATLFWPFYFQEPAHAGCTFHLIVEEPDAGEVLHQVTPTLHPDDGIHDVACKTVLAAAEDAPRLVDILAQGGAWSTWPQSFSGKLFLSSDFRPEHLRVNYGLFGDRMAEAWLTGNLNSKAPKLIRQF